MARLIASYCLRMVRMSAVTALSASLGLCQSPARDLTAISLEDLMNIQVTSVSKKEQKLAKTGAAVFVITQEDIHRSGATNIPDLLRMAPGVDVARLDANRWAISIRGFNSIYANKVLVLIDGRTVYLDSSSNVFWDQQDIPLEDIDHIEVIRGSGGTVWGANAVNGVIRVITKNASATPGGLVTAGTGSEESAEGLVQYGGSLGSKGAYRVFGRYFNVETSLGPNGENAADGWHGSHGGFRSDWNLSSRDALTFQGDMLRSAAGQTVNAVFLIPQPLQTVLSGRLTNATGNVLGKWTHTLRNGSETSLQMFYDYNHRAASASQVDETHNMLDFDFQHHLAPNSRNDVVWGIGYRFENDDILPSTGIRFVPEQRNLSLFSAFVQDEISLSRSLFFTVGSKLEHNGLTGFEYEPSAQLVWTPSRRHTLWVSAARTIRQPSLVDFGLQKDLAVTTLPTGVLAVPTLMGSTSMQPEQLRDYEVGYRAQLSLRLSLDLTAFAGFYRRLETVEPRTPFFTLTPPRPRLVIPLVFDNLARAQNYGGELSVTWNVNSHWKFSPSYSLLHMAIELDPSSRGSSLSQIGDSPKHQFQMRSWWNLRKNLDADTTLMYVSSLSHFGIPSYTRLDTRLGWRLGEFVELSVVGQNLLRARHAEFFDSTVHGTEIERSVFGKVTWRF